jgi:hypothetical protein
MGSSLSECDFVTTETKLDRSWEPDAERRERVNCKSSCFAKYPNVIQTNTI